MTEVAYGERLSRLATERPDRLALQVIAADGRSDQYTYAQLERRARQTAGMLAARGVGPGAMVVVAFPNSSAHFLAVLATWKLGGCVLPLSWKLTPREQTEILKVAEPAIVCTDSHLAAAVPAVVTSEDIGNTAGDDAPSFPPVVSEPGKAIASGGSTGRPKIIVDPRPWVAEPGRGIAWAGFRPGMRQLVTGPLYHNTPFGFSHSGLFEGGHVVVMERFDAAQAVELITRYQIEFLGTVPTVMSRMLRVIDGRRDTMPALRAIAHTGGPCAPWLKEAWIRLVGAESVYEAFGSAENVGLVTIRGDEWLAHRGSLGRPLDTEVRIVVNGRAAGPLTVGEIYMGWKDRRHTFEYIGSDPPATTDDGLVCVGDLGWVNEDGWLYLADRRTDMIVTGGANVYPAEVEAVITSHPLVRDCVVVGAPDPDWGRRVHALVQPASPDLTIDAIQALCRELLAPYKRPKTIGLTDLTLRDESGKVRRSALVAEISTREPET